MNYKSILYIILFSLFAFNTYAYSYSLHEDFNDPLDNNTWQIANIDAGFQFDNASLICSAGVGQGYGAMWLIDTSADFGIENNITFTFGWEACPYGEYFGGSNCAYSSPSPYISRYLTPTQTRNSNETINNNSAVYLDMSAVNMKAFERWDGNYYPSTSTVFKGLFYDSDPLGDFEIDYEIRIEITPNINGTRNIKAYRNDTLRYTNDSILQFDVSDEQYEYFALPCAGGGNHKYVFDYFNIDIVSSGVTINTSAYVLPIYECNDTIDNDLDGYTDYPNDPSCSSYTDNDESPFDTPQCDDGIDNDLDGYTDYPEDPSCYSLIDNTESPKDQSFEAEDNCLESLDCLIYDSVPYSDSPILHKWYGGQVSATETISNLGGYSIDLKTIDEYDIFEHVILYKNISNTNNYNNIEGEVVLAVYDQTNPLEYESIDGNEVIIGFYDYFDNRVAELYINFTIPSDTAYDVEADIYVYDSDQYVYVGKAYTDDSDNGYLRFSFEFDELSNIYTFSWTDMLGTTNAGGTYNYDDNAISQIHKFAIANTLDSDFSDVLLHSITLSGVDILDFETFCTEYDLPYVLKEDFNGYMSECDWNSEPDIFFYGNLLMKNEIESYMLYKIFVDNTDDALYESNCRYSVTEFDLTAYSDSTNSNIFNVYLYDLAFQEAFIRLYFYDDGNIDTISGGDTINLYSSFATDVTVPIKFHVDLLQDTFDLYYNGSLVSADNGYFSEVSNIEYYNGIYFSSSESHFEIDNLEVYSADSGMNPTACVPDDLTTNVNENTMMCDLFTKETLLCNDDTDCATGLCTPNGYCSRFDFTYCDDKEYTRGNKCIMAGIGSCVLTNTGDVITDNFFLFLVFLIITMFLIYLVIMLRSGSG